MTILVCPSSPLFEQPINRWVFDIHMSVFHWNIFRPRCANATTREQPVCVCAQWSLVVGCPPWLTTIHYS